MGLFRARDVSLVRLAAPETETRIALIVCAFNAAEIPHLVHNYGFGSLWPGIQISAYNSRSILVPEDDAREAFALLESLFLTDETPETVATPRDTFRMVIEALMLGWMLPRGRRRRGAGREYVKGAMLPAPQADA